MSRTKRNKVPYGTEWWGRRPYSKISVSMNGMKKWKALLHRCERLVAKITIRKELKDDLL